ncbi:sulfoxide reductase catalytic subunit [Ketogulonicigenium robustum]|uniref:Protein-methionine-sulfoxide reductase catalytic subunit MsrP n=1 Tax=Ketogulonicigenium robustum TaxID=92947 RepID=A0A1W6NWH5_9RHOB|nr:protein-methionine-sulfoxide reductase catalytic subunit MsrP [Ketogulonicigenium robustum]ARO13387.1 sulfoxide reductase catalytic subunit [Ketogulonicigenium robustum]
MAYRWKNDLTRADATPRALFASRRQVLAGLAASGFATPALALGRSDANTLEQIRSYNNYYEFGFQKEEPAKHAGALVTDDWRVEVGGLVDNPGSYTLEDLIGGLTVEERIYRLRCVEAWSMVIPWSGVELADVLGRIGVQDGARYVAFETVLQPAAMWNANARGMDFPYVEGLRLDEAMHPLTLLATGIYGEPLANQNGAPIRLVVPWKYGFKSIKSIVRITLTAEQPITTWTRIDANEYGFYANVNPQVDHPRWSQATERPVGVGLFGGRRDTLMFNGYDEVAPLYAGMDLRVDY